MIYTPGAPLSSSGVQRWGLLWHQISKCLYNNINFLDIIWLKDWVTSSWVMSSTDNTNSFTVGQDVTPAATVTINNAGNVTVAKPISSQVIPAIVLQYNIIITINRFNINNNYWWQRDNSYCSRYNQEWWLIHWCCRALRHPPWLARALRKYRRVGVTKETRLARCLWRRVKVCMESFIAGVLTAQLSWALYGSWHVSCIIIKEIIIHAMD